VKLGTTNDRDTL